MSDLEARLNDLVERGYYPGIRGTWSRDEGFAWEVELWASSRLDGGRGPVEHEGVVYHPVGEPIEVVAHSVGRDLTAAVESATRKAEAEINGQIAELDALDG